MINYKWIKGENYESGILHKYILGNDDGIDGGYSIEIEEWSLDKILVTILLATGSNILDKVSTISLSFTGDLTLEFSYTEEDPKPDYGFSSSNEYIGFIIDKYRNEDNSIENIVSNNMIKGYTLSEQIINRYYYKHTFTKSHDNITTNSPEEFRSKYKNDYENDMSNKVQGVTQVLGSILGQVYDLTVPCYNRPEEKKFNCIGSLINESNNSSGTSTFNTFEEWII